MNPLNVAIVGAGKMGILHAAILNSLPDCRVTAIVDKEKMITRFIEKNTSEIEIYSDHLKMLKQSNVDVVYITTPISSHIPIALDCLQYQKHLFIEKPLGKNSKECEILCKQDTKVDTKKMVGFYLRYSKTFSKAQELLQQGIIGDLSTFDSSVYQTQFTDNSKGWRFDKNVSGGGVLIDLGVHLVDLLIWFFGSIKSVNTNNMTSNSQVETSCSGTLKFNSGLEGTIDVSWEKPGHRLQETTIKVIGKYGTLTVNEDYIEIKSNHEGKLKNLQDSIIYRQSLAHGVIIDIGGPEYTSEDEDFIACIRKNKTPESNLFNATNVQKIIDLFYDSFKEKSQKIVNYFV